MKEKKYKVFLRSRKNPHQTQNIIWELTNENNGFLNTDEEILGEMCNFYEKLYDTQNINNSDIENYLRDTDIKRLTDNIKDKCDQFPTLDECKETVMDMKHNKSPGLDGLPAEFYQCFWDQLSELFFEMLTEIFRMNEMTFSQ